MVEFEIKDNESGIQYQVMLGVTGSYSEETNWQWKIYLSQRNKGKRKWISLNREISDSYEYRRLDISKRNDYMRHQLQPILEQISRIAGYDIIEHMKQLFFNKIINLPIQYPSY